MSHSNNAQLDWNSIDTVLLDMDGTLLDLHFDFFFWTEHLPAKYSAAHNAEIKEAANYIAKRLKEKQRLLQWYCTEYWSEQFQLNIIEAQTEIKHLINERPQALTFLEQLAKQHKKPILVTNSDRPSIELKFANSAIAPYFDQVIASHDYGAAKEHQQFWLQLQQQLPFNPETTLFIDDSESVLDSAHQFGIKHLFSIEQPDSVQSRVSDSKYPMISNFLSLLPGNYNG